MLKGKKKALAAQVLLGLMVAGNVYTVDCGVASAAEGADIEIGEQVGWWIGDDTVVSDNEKLKSELVTDNAIKEKSINLKCGGGNFTLLKADVVENNIIQIGNEEKYSDPQEYWGNIKIVDSAKSSGNVLEVYRTKNTGSAKFILGAKDTAIVKGLSAKHSFQAGTIKIEGSDLELGDVDAYSAAGEGSLVEIAGKGVSADKTLTQKLKISANGFTNDDLSKLKLDEGLADTNEDNAKKCNKIIVDGNDVNFVGTEFWKSFDVNGDNFNVGNIHSYIGNDVVSVAGNKANMGNIELAGTSSTLNVSGNDAKLGDVYGSGASSVNISGNNVTVGNITTVAPVAAATKAAGGNNIVISGNGTKTGELKTGTLEITGNGTLHAENVDHVDKIVIKSTATGTVFTATSDLNGKLDSAASQTTDTTALFNNRYAASYDSNNNSIMNTQTTEVREQSKSYVETQMATLAMVASGADLLANAGFTNAAQAVQDAKDSGDSGRSMVPYAAANYGSMRQESGSHVDVKGSNFNIGFAKEVKNGSGKLLFGPMFEYGRGNYDSYLDDGTTGSGTAQNYGIGMMARQTNDNGFYYEGSVRYGKVTSDYSSSNVWAGHDVSYDNSAKYWGAHVGVGKLQKLGGDNAIDLYGKLFYTNQGSSSVNINGDTLDFSSVKSKRSRIGFRYIHGTSDVRSVYAGLAWQYEFDGAAYATANGLSTPSPSVKGSSGMLELGVLIAPKASPVSFDLGVSGWAGKQKGYSLNANMLWSF